MNVWLPCETSTGCGDHGEPDPQPPPVTATVLCQRETDDLPAAAINRAVCDVSLRLVRYATAVPGGRETGSRINDLCMQEGGIRDE